jgi:hypothetical protein
MHPTIQVHTKMTEDRIYLLCGAVAQCLFGEDRYFEHLFSTRTASTLAVGLQKTLLSASRIVMQSARQTGTLQHNDSVDA